MYEKRVMMMMMSHVPHILCNQRKLPLENGVKKGVYNIHGFVYYLYILNIMNRIS